jgi:conjugal transfer/type IV secretion protein DotA/TraY
MAVKLQNLNAKSIARYMVMPGIIPRAIELGSSGFGYLAFLFASVYRAVRILPEGHPYTNPANIGKFGIVKVIAAAANNVQVNRRNIDQVIVFIALLAAVILMFFQFILLLIALFSGRAFAGAGGGAPFQSMFVTQHPGTDIAFLLLDYVFGIPGQGNGSAFFGSNALTGGPTAFHQGMHALFNFYNLAILLVAALIFLYFIFVVVVETAQTGVPFGKRFSKIYAPFRLIIAVGLLVPLNYGFNGAQYITLYVAKLGSSFATNGWILYNQTLQNPMAVDNNSLVAKPNAPSIEELLHFSSVYHACRQVYADLPLSPEAKAKGRVIKPYVVIEGRAQEFLDYTYVEAKKFYGKTDLEVLLGEMDEKEHTSHSGNVRPYCGRIIISLNFDNPVGWKDNSRGNPTGQRSESAQAAQSERASGIRAIEEMYFNTIKEILRPEKVWAAFGERYAKIALPTKEENKVCHRSDILGDGSDCQSNQGVPKSASFEASRKAQSDSHKALIDTYYETFRKGLDLKITDEIKKRGWGGAGIWYNTVADLNGTFTGALYATPSVKRYPEVMEKVKNERQANNVSGGVCDMFTPSTSGEKPIAFQQEGDRFIASALSNTYRYFACENAVADSGKSGAGGTGTAPVKSSRQTENIFTQTVNLVFGLNGLFEVRQNSQIDERTGQPIVHPLAQLSTIGKSLVENAIRSMAVAMGAAFGGGFLSGFGLSSFGAAAMSFSGMFVAIATIGLTAGFILYYILPFLPFIYFFFAVGSWVKSIFEAMVGVPLWALAHLRIDGEGLPGKAAIGGYYLLFEIFLRPIVTVFGLIAGIAIFGTLAGMLNNLFDLVIFNITGAAPGKSNDSILIGSIESFQRGVIDQFFFTIMYAVLLYLMATSSFKMIDTIPKSFMRWMGKSVPTFNDNTQDPTSGLVQYAAVGGSQISGQVLEGVKQGATSVGQLGGGLLKAMSDGGKAETPKGGGA